MDLQFCGLSNLVDEVIDRIMEEEYHLRPDGLPGNDDLGAMGALVCLGFLRNVSYGSRRRRTVLVDT